MSTSRHTPVRTACLAGLILSTQAALGQTFTPLGFLPESEAVATAVSADGSVVAGYATGPGVLRAFRWTASDGLVPLALPDGAFESSATGVSGDGRFIVGVVVSILPEIGYIHRPWRWDAEGGMLDLGNLPDPTTSGVNAISTDGTVVVGQSLSSSGWNRAFRWTSATGIRALGNLEGGHYSSAEAVSGDGAVVVGSADAPDRLTNRAFRWTSATGLVDLGVLPGELSSAAYGTNADGSIVVGRATVGENTPGGRQGRAMRWTAADGMTDLGTLSGYRDSVALGVSGDGSIVVGSVGQNADHPGDRTFDRAFIWSTAHGMIDLNAYLAAAGVNLRGYSLLWAHAISADGSTVVGTALNPCRGHEPWRVVLNATTPPCAADFNADGNADPDDLADYIGAYFASPSDPRAEFDGVCGITPDDLADFIAEFFTNCR